MVLADIRDVIIDTTPGVKNPSKYHLPRPWRKAGRERRRQRTVEELQRILQPHKQ